MIVGNEGARAFDMREGDIIMAELTKAASVRLRRSFGMRDGEPSESEARAVHSRRLRGEAVSETVSVSKTDVW